MSARDELLQYADRYGYTEHVNALLDAFAVEVRAEQTAEIDRLCAKLETTVGHRDYWHAELKCADARIAELERERRTAASATAAGDEQPMPQIRLCGHDDYHDGHHWADQPHTWCPGHALEGGDR